MSQTQIRIRISRIGDGTTRLPLPAYATAGSSGMDLRSVVEMIVRPGESVLVPTGLQIEIPPGYEAQVRPRSGLAINHQIGVLNSPGTIDSDYRGEIKVILTNFGKKEFDIRSGDRIAQMVITPVVRAEWIEVPAVDQTARGEGGFGHTGS